MASSSGNSSGSAPIQNSGSEGDLQMLTDERKRKRMQSNRESARRSRMRRQNHLDDLMDQVTQLRRENNRILTGISVTTQHFLNVEAENSVLHAQMAELTQRLQSLNDILGYMNTNGGPGADASVGGFDAEDFPVTGVNGFLNVDPWSMGMMYFNQPIMASPNIFPY